MADTDDLRGDRHGDLQAFECPRCHQPVTEAFYGPCHACRHELRTVLGAAERTIELAEYEPKMNVTPNAVALKE